MLIASSRKFSKLERHETPPPPTQIITGLGLAWLIVTAGCTKELNAPEEKTYTSAELEVISDAFDPPMEEVMPMIRTFNERMDAFRGGDRDEVEERRLSEGVWMSEADLNYQRGDARAMGDSTIRDSIIVELPCYQKSDGEWWVLGEEFAEMHDALLAGIPVDQNGQPTRYIDLAVTRIANGMATIRAFTHRRYVPWVPSDPPEGCFNMQGPQDELFPAEIAMNQWIAWNDFYELNGGITDWHPPFYVTVSTLQAMSTVDWVGNLNGYSVYLGSDEDLGGPDWLESGQSSDEVCFPDYWNKFLAMQDWYFGQFVYEPGRVMVDKVYVTNYSVRTGGPMSYGSPYFPMGPWDHQLRFRRGRLIR